MADVSQHRCQQLNKVEYVRSEWLQLCNLVSISKDLAEKWWMYVQNCYQSDGRHYHTLSHIYSMINNLSNFKEKIKCYEEVSLAIFFHDIIYEPKQQDNEEKSAEVFMKFVEECINGNGKINPVRVYDMIIMTKHHQTEVHGSADSKLFGLDDFHYFLDCDMAILGQNKEVYDDYSAAVRQEYIHIEEELYCQRRKSVLEKFLESPKIYATKQFYELYEDSARTNLRAEIASLKF